MIPYLPGSAIDAIGAIGAASSAPIDTSNDLASAFRPDVGALRERAWKNLHDGAVTPGYAADRSMVLQLLNTALATELICVLRYKRHQFMAQGIHAPGIAAEFREHAAEELGHADQLASRIVQLGGEPDFSPNGLSARSHAEYRTGTDLVSMLEEDLVAERIAIDSYRDTLRYLGGDDPTTSIMIGGILATEEQHADELASLLRGLKNGPSR